MSWCYTFGQPSLPNLLLITFICQVPVFSGASDCGTSNYNGLLSSAASLNLPSLYSLAYDSTINYDNLYPPVTKKYSDRSYHCPAYSYKKAEKKISKKNRYPCYAYSSALLPSSSAQPEYVNTVATPQSAAESVKYIPYAYYIPVPYCCSPLPAYPPPPSSPPSPLPPPSPPPPPIDALPPSPPILPVPSLKPKIKLSILESLYPFYSDVETCSCLINAEDLCTTKEIGNKPKLLTSLEKKELLSELKPLVETLIEKILKPKKPKCYCLCFKDDENCPPGTVSSKKTCLDKIMQMIELTKGDKKAKKKCKKCKKKKWKKKCHEDD